MNRLKSLSPLVKTALITFIAFLFWLAYLIARYKGLYAFDEMYHISSSDAYFHSISEYARAPYLNGTVRFLTSVFGRHYYTYKLIPFILSLVSIGSLLYLASKLFQHTYNVVLFTLLCAGHCVLIFNHLYVRMYVWDEAVISLLAIIMYKLSHTTSLYKRMGLHILYFGISAILYVIQPSEQSSISVLFVGIAGWCLNYWGQRLISFIKSRKLLMPVLCLFILIMLGAECMLLLLRTENPPIPSFLSKLVDSFRQVTKFNTIGIGIPNFTLYFICQNLLLTIGLFGYGYSLLKDKFEKNNMIGIYSLALLPFLAYNMLYFDNGLFRSFASFMPILILIAILWLDHFTDTKFYKYISMIIVLITILFSNPGLKQNPIKNMMAFFQNPYIYNETYFNEYEALINHACEDIKNGRKCISIFSSVHQQAAFELNAEYSIALEDSINVPVGYTTEDLELLLSYLQETEEQYVLMVAFHAAWRLDGLIPGTMDSLRSLYPYIRYGHDEAYLFYIN